MATLAELRKRTAPKVDEEIMDPIDLNFFMIERGADSFGRVFIDGKITYTLSILPICDYVDGGSKTPLFDIVADELSSMFNTYGVTVTSYDGIYKGVGIQLSFDSKHERAFINYLMGVRSIPLITDTLKQITADLFILNELDFGRIYVSVDDYCNLVFTYLSANMDQHLSEDLYEFIYTGYCDHVDDNDEIGEALMRLRLLQ